MATTALRGLQVLEVLAGMRQPARLADVARRAGLSEPQTFRILRALELDGYLEHLGRSGYRLGSRSVALGALVGPRPALLRAVYPLVSRLAATTGEAVVVHLRSGSDRVLVLGVPSPSGPARDPGGMLGERSPLWVGASGRAILAFLPPETVAGLELDPAVLPRLDGIRARGYETSYGENHPGINGISAPLLTDDGVALGAITVAGVAAQLPAARLAQVAPMLLARSAELAPRIANLLGPEAGLVLDALDLSAPRP